MERSRWGEEFDEELQNKREVEFGILFSFKSMSHVVGRISDETAEWDAKHPKDKLIRIWLYAMIIIMILMTFTYNVLAIATGFFYIFYFYVIFQVFGAWKRFNYSKLQYWLMTLAGLGIDFAISWFLRNWIFGA